MRPSLLLLVLSVIPSCRGDDTSLDRHFQQEQEDYNNALDESLRQIRRQYGGVALAGITLDDQGNICAAGADGERIVGSKLPVHAVEGRWQIGSCTKSMTAVLMAMMIEEGSFGEGITWESPLVDIIPESLMLPDDSSSSPYAQVSIQQLLSMTAGLARDPPDGWEQYPETGLPLKEQRQKVARDAMQSVPENEPGTEFLYSNWGYVLAGAILEAHTGQLWEELVVEKIFEPLGIDIDVDMDFGVPRGENDPWGHRAGMLWGYKACDPSKKPCGALPVMFPCGGFTGSSVSMVAYLAWHMRCHNGLSQEGDPKLSTASCQKLHTPVDVSISTYALGWNCVERPWAGDSLACSHSGSIGFWFYDMWIAPGISRAFISMTNSRRDVGRRMIEARTTDEAAAMMVLSNVSCKSPSSDVPLMKNSHQTALEEGA